MKNQGLLRFLLLYLIPLIDRIAVIQEPHESRPSPNKRVIQNDKRRLEMKRITAENQRLAARIQNCKPTFSSHELVKHAQKHEKRM